MKRPLSAAVAVCASLVLLTGCGGGTAGPDAKSPSPGGGSEPSGTPSASRSPVAGKGSADPDDINGDGHRDLLLPVETRAGESRSEPSDERVLVVYGSARGLDPATRTVWGRGDLGLPAAQSPTGTDRPEAVDARQVAVANLDGDGFPDLTVPVIGEETVSDGMLSARPTVSYVIWGAARGPGSAGRGPTKLRLPPAASVLRFHTVVRGDFDGDGRRDVVVGDDGSRNDEPGSGAEVPEVAGALTMYPGDGGAPVRRELPTSSRHRQGFQTTLVYAAGDPDGDGRDGVLVPTDHGVALLNGTDEVVELDPQGPAHALPYSAADFNTDGHDELILSAPPHWWITSGRRDGSMEPLRRLSSGARGGAPRPQPYVAATNSRIAAAKARG
ncbi:FG-GAP repeat domain-containing protein [Streptomyces sp. NPDC051684]|uniref:FG-GAP repeat domain-containing protein n=1 Tax=Streptomyces sp. NPDC051684 TaxID=3365670 RepID=UPI0037917DAD